MSIQNEIYLIYGQSNNLSGHSYFYSFQNEIFRLAIKPDIITMLQNCTPTLPWHASCDRIIMTAAPERG